MKKTEKKEKICFCTSYIWHDWRNTYPKIVQAKATHTGIIFCHSFQCLYWIWQCTRNNYLQKKIKGIEKGKKRERAYITDKNNIRNIISKTKNEIEVIVLLCWRRSWNWNSKPMNRQSNRDLKSKAKGLNSL
jgi:hypothetical protein